MAQETRPRLFILRLLPVGVGTAFIAAICWTIAFAAAEGGVSADDLGAVFTVAAPLSVMAALLLLVPASLIWIVSYETLRINFPSAQTAATISIGLTAAGGVMAMMLFFQQMTAGGWQMVRLLAPASVLPLFLAMLWTWRLFAREGSVQ